MSGKVAQGVKEIGLSVGVEGRNPGMARIRADSHDDRLGGRSEFRLHSQAALKVDAENGIKQQLA